MMLHKLVQVLPNGTHKNLTDDDGLNIITNDVYGQTSQMTLQLAQQVVGNVMWEEIK